MKKLPATSMFYALMIVLLISIITSSMLLANELFHKELSIYDRESKLIDNCLSGINLLLTEPKNFACGEEYEINLYNLESDSVRLKRNSWGIFEHVSCTAFDRDKSVARSYITAAKVEHQDRFALYLANRVRPLALAGRTEIIGDAYLPEAGVKRGYVGSQAFVGSQLIQGQKLQSQRRIPSLPPSLLQDATKYFSMDFHPDEAIRIWSDFVEDSLVVEFAEPTQILWSSDSLSTQGLVIKGNVRVVSSKAVFLHSESQVENAIIYAPRITVDSLFAGSCQLFASESITIENNTQLSYPSVAMVLSDDHRKIELGVGESCQIEGVLILSSKDPHSRVTIGKDTQVLGQVFSNAMTDLKGSIAGSLCTNGIILQTPSSTYENHLLNARISSRDLPDPFFGIGILASSRPNQPIIQLK